MISHLDLYLLLAACALFTSVFFFVTSGELPFFMRAFASAHGVCAVAAVGYGIFMDFELARCGVSGAWFGTSFLLLLTVASIAASFLTYPGPKFRHVLHCAAVALIISSFPLISIIAVSERKLGLCAL
ncbi:MAG: hypothetical protein R3358_06690 [Woeseiaceae bacterium]|nr:hypothetical protein [Woeseiaceae bacterium]